MSKRESLSRFNLIIKKLRKNPSTYNEITDYLSRESELQSYNFVTSKRTFQRDLEDIRSLFNIDIQYDFSKRIYFIFDEDRPEATDRILEAFDMFNALNVSDRFSQHIQFEKRKPLGTENLFGLLHAIKNRFQIQFNYHKFWDETPFGRIVEPLALKEFRNRWYVIAREPDDSLVKTFALDRLSNLHITRKVFIYPTDFSIEEKFRYCFGIISPEDEKPEDIILSFDSFQGKYIKTLPLHETQMVLIDNEDELQISLKLCITHDLVMELLSYGETMKVIKPKSLADMIIKAHYDAFANYNKEAI
jgi:predicted DNA-binding transcriptional regulator YafY